MVAKSQYDIIIKKYDGNLALVFELARLIERNYSELFHSVIVHGSVATNEVIPYSDFDGLLIVRDDFVTSKRLQKFKKESMRIIYKFDPLQHHGWFQIIESDLLNYPENYLPVSSLKHSKLIYPIQDSLNFNLEVSNTIDYKISLEGILNQFETRIQNQWEPNNIYELKSILSQIMLIPCLYYSAINNNGIFKRESFEAVKINFTEQEWKPIKIASQVRKDWDKELNFFQSFLLKQTNTLLRKIIRKYVAPRINSKTKEKLNSEFYSNLYKLIQKIKIEIQ